MDGNRDDAERCLQLASLALKANDAPKAARLLAKSRRMYPLTEQQAHLAAALHLHNLSAASSSSSPSLRRSSDPPVAKPAPEEHLQPPRQPTPSMLAAVRSVQRAKHKSHYHVLGVASDADDAAVKRAYRQLALRLHPDRNCAPGADDAFKRLGQAFVVLSDPPRRAHYDQFGTDGPEQPPVRTGVRRRRRGRPGAAPTQGQQFHQFAFGGPEISPEDLFDFLFQAGAMGPHAFGPQTPQEEVRREYREYQEEHSFWDRFKPFMLLVMVVCLAMLATTQDGAQLNYSLFRTAYHSRAGVTRNDVAYYTAPGMDLSQVKVRRRLERRVDIAALDEYSGQCQREIAQEESLLRQSRRWLIRRKERELYRERYERFEKPWCGKARQLHEQLQRQRSY